jgi:TnpA family transposase
MPSIDRTAYPRFKRTPTRQELEAIYTPTEAELAFVTTTAREDLHRLHLLLWLKSFQRLGYFPLLTDIPSAIVEHLRAGLALDGTIQPGYAHPKMRYRHQQAVREFLQVQVFDETARQVVTTTVEQAAAILDSPADLINVALEELVRLRYELPAFSTLDRLVSHVRTQVNTALFARVQARLTPAEQTMYQGLLLVRNRRSGFQALKELPKSPTVGHLKELEAKLNWLEQLGDTDRLLEGIPLAKIKHFAAEAGVQDAGTMADFEPPKRLTLIICLIHQERMTARDDVVTMLLKSMAHIQKEAQAELARLREAHKSTTLALVDTLAEIAGASADTPEPALLGQQVQALIESRGGATALLEDCATIASYHSNTYQPLLWRFYKSHRKVLFQIMRLLTIRSTTQDQTLCKALEFVLENQRKRSEWLRGDLDLSFASDLWQRLIIDRRRRKPRLARRQLEVCVFVYAAYELKTGDLCVTGSAQYADYRAQLLSWEECAPRVADYCKALGLPTTPQAFVAGLVDWLTTTAAKVDQTFPANQQLRITPQGEPVLQRLRRQPTSPSLAPLRAALDLQLPQRHLLDIVRNVEHWTNWSRHFGPLSGADPKLENPRERYILTTFSYGTNIGPAQMARHLRGRVSAHQIWSVNLRHITAERIDAAIRDIVNCYSRFRLPRLWGDEKVAAADGTKFELYEENLLAEYHIRYDGYGGIAYHHVSALYIALISHFIVCGAWEAIYLLDGLEKNTSDIQPDTIHADTQGQSAPVFGMAYLMGIKLMPRIRNWKDLVFYRPSKGTVYQHIDSLFSDVIDWQLIETHWQDLFQVVLSIKAGKVLPSMLLQKLSTYSRKNRLYQAFRELGRVVRTVFLLQYLSDTQLREQIQAMTNKVEAYNGFSKWINFGGEGVWAENDPAELEKRVKYNGLVANAVILQNVVDMTAALRTLAADGHTVKREDIAALSPYWTSHIQRFGDYVLNLDELPDPLDEDLALPV